MDNLEPVFLREKIIRSTREFFYSQNFHEVIVPVLNKAVPREENIRPFKTDGYFLSTSPERGLKRMLAKGIGDCFAISKSFRAFEGRGSQHIPEFLMLEWYRKDADYLQIMHDARKLITKLGYKGNWKTVSLKDLFQHHAGMSLEKSLEGNDRPQWRGLWDQIFVNKIEPLICEGAVFVTDFPYRISPLCKQKKDEPYLAQRFELYVEGVEIANGNTENTDAAAVGKIADREFLRALDYLKNASYAGCGLGIDRLAMVLTGAGTILEVEQLLES